jgi:hypothetical protein
MLRATRRGSRRPTFDISESGRRVVTFAKADWRGCEFVVAGQRLRVSHEGRTRVTLIGPTGYVATADGDRDRARWTISSAAGRWELLRPSPFDETWELCRDGFPVGALRQDGARSTASHADLPGDVPLPLRVFFYYLALWLWDASRTAPPR